MGQNTLATRLKELRAKSGTSQQALADAVHVVKQTVSGYENLGNIPDIDIMIRIANYFEVSVDYLIGAVDEPTPITKIKPYELTENEIIMIENIRSLPQDIRETVQKFAQQLHNLRYN
ncbi:helix-turn-helix domain-containing protein [Harryflintia acetispora]|uniref:helix-turn-helix domain-containing protein n=1 Tax=Harryflintia acetispora TaxID=1849041 RepID=UPI001897FCCF|nr:helix-turn-helix domain-containing protein [Harryflintia acetispora]